jgi:hypothetical protein
MYIYMCVCVYRVSQEECAILGESVAYVKLYRYNPKHLYPKLNSYRDNGQRKVWTSSGSTHCSCQLKILSMPVLECRIMLPQLQLTLHMYCLQGDVSAGFPVPCIVLGILTGKCGIIVSVFVIQFNGFMSLIC